MSVQTQIVDFLRKNGKSTVNEIADGIGYSNNYTRQNAKELKADGKIQGAKTDRIPAVIINGNYEVLTGDRDYLLSIVKRYAPSKLGKAKGLPVGKLQKLIRDEIADAVVGGPYRWKFWI